MKAQIRQFLRAALALLFALALPACLQNETTIHLNKDGSGTVVDETILGAQMLAMMAQFGDAGGPDPLDDMFSEDKAKAKAAKMGVGVKYVKTERINQDGKKGARVFYEFADINTLKVEPGGAVEEMSDQVPAPEEEKKTKSVSFQYADGKLLITTPPTDFGDMDMPGDGEEANPQMEAMMKEMLADMRIGLKITFPGGIAETNASHREGNTLTLFDVKVAEMLAQKEQLEKITELGKTDEKAAIEAIKTIKGVTVETEKEVSVTLE